MWSKGLCEHFVHSGKNRSAMQSTRLDLTAPNNKRRLVYDHE